MKTIDELIAEAPDEEPTPQPTNIVAYTPACEPTMSSLQIAEITGKPHNDILKDIRRILDEAEIDAGKFSHVYKGGNGQERPCYILPRRECDLVVSGYSVKYRLAIIDRWRELEAKQASPQAMLSDPTALRSILLASVEREIKLLEENAELKPKAAGLDRIADTKETYCITDAAKSLNVPPKRLFEYLESNKWIYRRHGEWIAMQDKLNNRLMSHKIRTYEGSATIHTSTQARITAKGIARLAEALSLPA